MPALQGINHGKTKKPETVYWKAYIIIGFIRKNKSKPFSLASYIIYFVLFWVLKKKNGNQNKYFLHISKTENNIFQIILLGNPHFPEATIAVK